MVLSHTFTGDPRSDQVFVALDLETTGLDHNRDTIIEVGAVKFQGDQVIDTFETFVNPGRSIRGTGGPSVDSSTSAGTRAATLPMSSRTPSPVTAAIATGDESAASARADLWPA